MVHLNYHSTLDFYQKIQALLLLLFSIVMDDFPTGVFFISGVEELFFRDFFVGNDSSSIVSSASPSDLSALAKQQIFAFFLIN